MELDELKQAWQTLDSRLERHNVLELQMFRDSKLDTLRRKLRPLRWGQSLQMLLGIAIVLLSVGFWTQFRDEPAMLATGIVMHAYGVMLIVLGGITQGLISQLDYSEPVLDIQKRLARLRRFYVINGMLSGLPWAFLYLLVMVMLARTGSDTNLYEAAPMFICINAAGGAAVLLAAAWFHRWSRNPSRPRLAQRMESSVAGASLQRAQAVIDEIKRFEID